MKLAITITNSVGGVVAVVICNRFLGPGLVSFLVPLGCLALQGALFLAVRGAK